MIVRIAGGYLGFSSLVSLGAIMRRMHNATIALVVFLLGAFSLIYIRSDGPQVDAAPQTNEDPLSTSFEMAYLQQAGSPTEKSQQLAAWMSEQQWQDLSLGRKALLMSGLAVRGNDEDVVSVRWTGSLLSRTTGNYAISVHQKDYCPGTCRLWIDGQLVLDATDIASVTTGQSTFVAEELALSQGEAVSLRMEFVHLPVARRQSPAFPTDSETIATLLWESADVPSQLIPHDAYLPPDGFAEVSATGVKAEYFSDGQFQQPLFTRLDPAVDLRSRVVMNSNQWAEHQAVRNDCFETLIEPEFLQSISNDLAEGYWDNAAIRDILEHATTLQRAEYADWLVQRPEVLAADPGQLADIFAPLATVPGDYRVRLLRAWSADRPHENVQVGFYPDVYEDKNSYPEDAGQFLKGQNADDLVSLAANDLKRPDGHCRIELLEVLAYGAVQGTHGGWLRTQLIEQMEDLPFNSDARASWLLALGVMDEIAGGRPIRPNLATPHLIEAMLIAQSNEMQFQVLGQFAPRQISIGNFVKAREFLDQHADKFQSAEQLQLIQQWRTSADQLEENWAQLIADRKAAQARGRTDDRIAVLQGRLRRAEQRGDSALAARYGNWISQANTGD